MQPALSFLGHCRYGYKNLDEVKEVVKSYEAAKIPLDTIWTDIDYMDHWKDFTLNESSFPMAGMQVELQPSYISL